MGRNGNERLAEFRRMLLGRRADLAAGLGIRFDTLARLGRVAEEDQAPITHEEFISLRRNNMDYEQWRLIEEALRRLNTGSYGICQACEERIPEKRLRAVPWARYCVGCQERLAEDDMPKPESEAEAWQWR
jgi:DnaK suppressor protein